MVMVTSDSNTTQSPAGSESVQASENKVLKFFSTISDRLSLANRIASRFSGARDFYGIFGYKPSLLPEDYLLKYTRQDSAARIIDAPANATWRNPPKVTGGSGFEAAWELLVRGQNLWPMFERIDKLSGLGRYSLGLLGFDKGALGSPVRGATKLLYIQPIGEGSVEDIPEFEQNTSNARFGMPLIYKVRLADPKYLVTTRGILESRGSGRLIEVHHSRILHVAENPLQDSLAGEPRIKRVFNLLDDLLKVVGGTSEAFWLTANRGLQADVDKEMQLDPEDADRLAEEIDEYVHQMRRILRTRGVKITNLGSDTPNPSGIFESLMMLISGATGIPKRILLGSESGQLASEQDRANWAERVIERRISFAEPQVLKPFIALMVASGVLPDPGDTLEFVWEDAFHLSPLEKSQTTAQTARTVANLQKGISDKTQPMIVRDEARAIIGLDPMTSKQQTEAEEVVEGQRNVEREKNEATAKAEAKVEGAPNVKT